MQPTMLDLDAPEKSSLLIALSGGGRHVPSVVDGVGSNVKLSPCS